MTEKVTSKRTTKRSIKTASAKPRTVRTKKVTSENPDRVAVLQTHVGFPLIIRGNPTEDQVIGFVNEQNRRYHAGEPGGPSGQPAFLVISGQWFESETEFETAPEKGIPINL